MCKKWLKGVAPDLLVFDVDGVLIDNQDSYTLVTAETVRWCWENFFGKKVDCEGYTAEYFNIAKTHPAFNDDVAASWVMLRAMLKTGRESMKEAFLSPDAWKKELYTFAADAFVEGLAREDTQAPSFGNIRIVFEEIYFGAEVYAELKGKVVYGAGGEGLWQKEAPGTSKDWKELGLPAGIYTGRSRDEMVTGYKTLNWRGFPDNMLISFDSGILKPSPEGLAILCERSGAKHPAFFGDTASDRAAQAAFGKGEFVGIGPVLGADSGNGSDEFLHFNTLEEALSSLLSS
ncbi:MAG: HAD family hydrolase [Synergistaceae bacterium]|nr:HAD family hydrolase [Synergistaceae bacterium]